MLPHVVTDVATRGGLTYLLLALWNNLPSSPCACRDRQLKQNFQWTMVAITAATGGVYVLQGMKERFGFEQRLVNCTIAFWCAPPGSGSTAVCSANRRPCVLPHHS